MHGRGPEHCTPRNGRARTALQAVRGNPQPRRTAVELRVEIYPERRAVSIRAAYHLANPGAVPIDSVHLMPGVRLSLDARFAPRGFSNSGVTRSVSANTRLPLDHSTRRGKPSTRRRIDPSRLETDRAAVNHRSHSSRGALAHPLDQVPTIASPSSPATAANTREFECTEALGRRSK